MAHTTTSAEDDPQWLPADWPWDFFRSDLQVSKMIIQRVRPVIDFSIPILPRYNSASAPKSGTVTIQLDSDENVDENKRAFIVDKIILPLEPFTDLNDPRQRRAYYIVGWPDLPSARPVIDCAQASEYVSPQVIENWEYRDFLRREEEKETAEAEAAIAAVAAAIAAEEGRPIAGVDPRILPNGKKKPGRKPKNARLLEARAPTPQLDSEQEKMLAKRRKGPSLSTPQKSRIAQFDAELEMDMLDSLDEDMDDGGDMDELLQRQMHIEARSEIADSMDEDGDDMDPLGPNTTAAGSSSLSHASNPGPPMFKGEYEDFGSFRVSLKPTPKSVQHNSVGYSLSSKSSTPQGPSPSQQPHRSSTPQRPSIPPPSRRPGQNTGRVSRTPIPLPPRLGLSSQSTASSLPGQTIVPSIEKGVSAHGRASMREPVTMAPDGQSHKAPRPSSSLRPSSSNGSNAFTPTNRFTPVGGHLTRPPKRSAEDSTESTPSTAQGKSERKRKAPKLAQPPPEAEPEQDFVVKRLEGDTIIDGEHWFRVRWEGDWPADQNPTWEPQANISAKLVKGYLKRKGEKEAKKQQAKSTPNKDTAGNLRGGSTGKSKGKQQSTLLDWTRQFNYGSVSDAFEGNAELEQTNGKRRDREGDGVRNDDEDELAGDEEEFLIVDNKRTADEREREAAEKRKSLSAQLAANLANM